MAELIIEVDDHAQRARSYYSVDTFPVHIGRGYDNDIILSDPHVCARHLVINAAEQGWVAEDAHSKNGVYDEEKTDKKEVIHLVSGDSLLIGKTHLRFLMPDHPVEPARLLSDANSIVGALKLLSVVWALLSILVMVFVFDQYLMSASKVHFGKLVADSMVVSASAVFWASIWSLLGFIVRRKLFFQYLLAVTVVYIVADLLVENIIDYVAFNINSTWISDFMSYVMGGLLLVAVLYASMKKVLLVSNKRKMILANVFSWLAVAAVGFTVYANAPDFNHNPVYAAELKPPFSRIVTSMTLDDFLYQSESIIDKIE
ncbi:MAG: FHA domain-containing protein [Gammaproteobacteria bacterium]|nr:FHA domain-containing protein [Gammaproteobacteria bacterium]